MIKKNIVFLFHIYQPSWQERSIFLDFYSTRYEPLIAYLEKNSNIKITLNIAGSLTEMLVREKKLDLIDRIRALVNKKQIELVGSAIYHPILPLIPEKEVVRQILLNEELNSKYFKDEWNANKLSGKGFYLPEVAYSNSVAKILKKEGFSWLTIDTSSVNFYANIDWNKKYVEEETGIKLFIRNPKVHNDNTMHDPIINNSNLVFVEDGEDKLIPTKDNLWWNIKIKKILGENSELNYMNVGEYLASIKDTEIQILKLQDSNWEITEEEYLEKSFYHIWDSKNDEIHQLLWKFIKEILTTLYNHQSDKNFEFAREELDKALSSCTWWWVDGRFNGYYPTAVQKGLDIMINVIRTIDELDLNTRITFEKIYSEILFKIWERLWKSKQT